MTVEEKVHRCKVLLSELNGLNKELITNDSISISINVQTVDSLFDPEAFIHITYTKEL